MPHAEIIATDLAPVAVSLIKEHAAAEGVFNVVAQQADAQDLRQFKDNYFAAVTCSYGLMFMPEHVKALQEAYRVLQSGGLYVATVWAPLESFQFGQVSFTSYRKQKQNGTLQIPAEHLSVRHEDACASRVTQQFAKCHDMLSYACNVLSWCCAVRSISCTKFNRPCYRHAIQFMAKLQGLVEPAELRLYIATVIVAYRCSLK